MPGKLPVPGRSTNLMIVGHGPTALTVGAWCFFFVFLLLFFFFFFFFLGYPFSFLSPSIGDGPIWTEILFPWAVKPTLSLSLSLSLSLFSVCVCLLCLGYLLCYLCLNKVGFTNTCMGMSLHFFHSSCLTHRVVTVTVCNYFPLGVIDLDCQNNIKQRKDCLNDTCRATCVAHLSLSKPN